MPIDPALSELQERVNSAEAKVATYQERFSAVKEEAQQVLRTFAARKRSDGSYDIDFDKFVRQLGLTKALELRHVIDEVYKVSGEAGEKPRVRLANG